MTIEHIAYELFSGNAILFAGAGFSFNSKNSTKKRPLFGDELAAIIAAKIGESTNTSLEEVSSYFIEDKGVDYVINFLKEQYQIVSFDDFYNAFILSPWRRIYTTNYDNLIDQILKTNKPKTEIKTSENLTKEVINLRGLCLHINGSIDTINRRNIHDFFKLTSRSYLTKVFTDSDWSGLFQNDLENSGAIIIIGYSFKNDLDLQRFFFNLPKNHDKTIIITKPGESQRNIKTLEKFGTVLPVGVEDFCKQIIALEPTIKPNNEIKFKSFCRVRTDNYDPIPSYTDSDIYSLFMYGNLQEKKVNNDKCYASYLVRRKKTYTIKKWIKENKNTIVIHSSLGNGKTIFLKELAFELSKEYDCYILQEFNEKTKFEVEAIISTPKKSIILIDNYLRYKTVIEHIDSFNNPQCIIIVFERTFSSYYLINTDKDYMLLEINKLDKDEINDLKNIMNMYPILWGSKAKLLDEDKIDYLTKECRSNFQTILVNLIRSQDIVNRYSIIFNDNKSIDFLILFNLILLNSYLDLRLSVENICYLLDNDILYKRDILTNEGIKELFDINNDIPLMRSSILAHELAKRIKNTSVIFNSLANIAERAQKIVKYDSTDIYFNLLKQINSYTNLRHLYGNIPNFHDCLSDYFQRLQYLSFYKKNSHFWLQYAIFRLDLGDISFSERCFEVARRYSGKGSFSQLFIDNHYSRLLLEKANKQAISSDEAFALFKQAHELLINPLFIKEEWNYIFKVALNYELLIHKYHNKMNSTQQTYIYDAIIRIKELLIEFKQKVDDYYIEERSNIRQCEEMIKRVEKSIKKTQNST